MTFFCYSAWCCACIPCCMKKMEKVNYICPSCHYVSQYTISRGCCSGCWIQKYFYVKIIEKIKICLWPCFYDNYKWIINLYSCIYYRYVNYIIIATISLIMFQSVYTVYSKLLGNFIFQFSKLFWQPLRVEYLSIIYLVIHTR